ncbi:MAG: hypothetical protein AB4372_19920 [Xenococcus sp. (in: cyanobacteria)]
MLNIILLVESKNQGKIVAINIETGAFEVVDDTMTTTRRNLNSLSRKQEELQQKKTNILEKRLLNS